MELLQDPGDFMLGLENQITRDDSSNHGGNSTHEACGAWSSPEPNTTTTTSTSPGSMSYDDTFQLIIHLLRDWAPEGKEIRLVRTTKPLHDEEGCLGWVMRLFMG